MEISRETTSEEPFGESINPSEGRRESLSRNQNIFSNSLSVIHSDNKNVACLCFEEYVESLIKNPVVSATDLSAYKSYLKYSRSVRQDISVRDISLSWVAMLLHNGSGYNTVRRYVSCLRKAFDNYNVSAVSEDNLSIKDLKKICDDHMVAAAQHNRRVSNLQLLKRIVRQRQFYDRESETWNIFLYLFYSCAASFTGAVNLRFDSIAADNYHIQNLADSCRTFAQRRYVFRLGQGKRRDKQIARDIITRTNRLLRSLGFDFGEDFGIDTVRSLWIDAAIDAGINLFDIRAVVDTPGDKDSWLNLVAKREIGAKQRMEILNSVAEYTNPYNESWHVMHLRNAVTPDDIRERTTERAPELLKRLTLYYPTREMVFKENKKIIRREIPYIPGLLFFKIGENRIPPLFREIGDLAWCYRARPAADAPYSVIPRGEMERFQRFVGKFTSDVEVSLSNQEPLGIGRRVRITGGLMEGYEGEIYDIEESAESSTGRRMFRLNLSSDQALRWTVSIEDIYIEPIDC